MGRGVSDAVAFAVAMTVRDMSKEREKRLIKTQKFYQECYEKIADDSQQAFQFARHGRALTGASPEHAQIVGSV